MDALILRIASMPDDLSLHINFAALPSQVARALKRIIEHVAIGLIASEQVKDEQLISPDLDNEELSKCIKLPQLMFTFVAAPEPTDIPALRASFKSWTIGNGLSDVIDIMDGFLDEIRTILILFDYVGVRHEVDINLAEKVMEKRTRFLKGGLEDKIKLIDKKMNGKFIGSLTPSLLSINKARNCLVHRHGLVSDMDTNVNDTLVVEWQKIEFFVKDPNGAETPVTSLPFVIDAGQTLACRTQLMKKTFAIGSSLEFSTQEFNDLGWSLFQYAQQSSQALENYAIDKGLLQKPTEVPEEPKT